MLEQAIEKILDVSADLKKPVEVCIDGVQRKTFLAINGNLTEYAHDVPPRQHECLLLESLGEWAGGELSSIWYSMDQVVVVLNDKEHRDSTVRMKLTRTSQWKAVADGVRNSDQSSFCRWCQDELRHELEKAHPNFIKLVRNIKINKGEHGEGNIAPGKESFGKSINAEVAGASEFPEELILKIPVWQELDIHVDYPMSFVVDPHSCQFSLYPFASTKQQACKSALEQLGEAVGEYEGESTLFCGTP